ncbi:MAG: lysoplasmalogenase [Ardenticatenaceae bacterium]|nr:lysoplasmalogenase [Ardenticatenaceae bacterium]
MLPFLLVYLALALFYLATQQRRLPAHFLIKALPILLLAIWNSNSSGWVVAALLFSAVGDIALALDGERYFVIGLGAFLLGHLCYIAAFLQNPAFQPVSLLPIIIILLLGGVVTWQLWPHLGKLKVPVVVYIVVSMGMGVSASLQRPFSWLAVVGAITFMLSDTGIAVDKFLRPFPHRDFLVMGSYYLAQLLITLGFVLSQTRL